MAELWGGPFDGHHIAVSEAAPMVRMPMATKHVARWDDEPEIAPIKLAIAVYHRVSTYKFIYSGMEV